MHADSKRWFTTQAKGTAPFSRPCAVERLGRSPAVPRKSGQSPAIGLACAGYMVVVGLALTAAGCGHSGEAAAVGARPAADVESAAYRLTDEPAGAMDLAAVYGDAEDGDDVVVAGRVGGRGNPWVENLAAFSVVDPAAAISHGSCCPDPSCGSAHGEPAVQALVRVVDAEGRTVAVDARELLGIEASQVVVVRGKARRDAAGNLSILADGVFVRP